MWAAAFARAMSPLAVVPCSEISAGPGVGVGETEGVALGEALGEELGVGVAVVATEALAASDPLGAGDRLGAADPEAEDCALEMAEAKALAVALADSEAEALADSEAEGSGVEVSMPKTKFPSAVSSKWSDLTVFIASTVLFMIW